MRPALLSGLVALLRPADVKQEDMNWEGSWALPVFMQQAAAAKIIWYLSTFLYSWLEDLHI